MSRIQKIEMGHLGRVLKAWGHVEANGHLWMEIEVLQGIVKEEARQVSCSPSTAMLTCQTETVCGQSAATEGF